MAENQTNEVLNTAPASVESGFKRFPFLKSEQQAGEKAGESAIKAKALQESTMLEEKGKALEKISTEDKAYYENVKSQMEKAPEFKPTQDNAMDIGGIFSMIATMGVALGGSGKLSGINALNAMGGMLKGYQSGRKDLFEKEQKVFDKEVSRIKSTNEMLLKDLEQYQKLRATDKDAALIKAQEISSKNPGVIAELINASRDEVVFEIARRNSDALIKVMELSSKHGLTGSEAALPKDAKTKSDYNTKLLSSKNIEEILTLLDDPKVSKLITPATQFTPAFVQNLRDRFPELGPKLARVQAIEFETGGKSLTKNEREILEPIYGWKGLKVDALRTRLGEAKRNLDNNLAFNEVTYPGFKVLRPKLEAVYQQSGTIPSAAPEVTPEQVDTLRSQAKARIAAGGDEEAVKARFKELTGKDL